MISGAATLLGARALVRLIGLLNIVVLARLLTPEDYGVFALAFVAITFGQVVSELSFGAAIIRLPDPERSHYDAAFTLSLIRGALIGLGLYAFAEPISGLLSTPELAEVLRWLAALPVLIGLGSPGFIAMARRNDFRRESTALVISRLISITVSVGVALHTPDYWALVAGTLTAAVAGVFIGYALAPWHPRLTLRHWRMFFAFGGWLTAANVVNFFTYKLDAAFLAAKLNTAAVGQFNMGEQIATMATHELAQPFTRTMFSGLSELAGDRARMIRGYIKAQATIQAVILPIGVGTALVAREAVFVLAGPKWVDAVVVVQFIAPLIALSMVASGAHAVLMVLGDTRSILMRNALTFAVRAPLIVAALHFFGFIGFLVARGVSSVFFVAVTLQVLSRKLEAPILTPFRASWRSFASCALMTIAVIVLDVADPSAGDGLIENATMLVMKAGIGGGVYLASHAALWFAAGRPDGPERVVIGVAERAWRKLQPNLGRRGGRG